jgi:hypothetical protein
MGKTHVFRAASLAATGAALVLSAGAANAQSRRVQPERSLLGVRLGQQFLDVLRRYGSPTEVQTVSLPGPNDALPSLGGGGAAAGGGMGEMGGMMGGGMMSGGMGGPPAGMMAGRMGAGRPGGLGGASMGGGGGIPTLPPAGGGGAGPYGGGGGMMGSGMMGGPPAVMMAGRMGGMMGSGRMGGMMGGAPGGMMGGPGGGMGAELGGGAAGGANMPAESTAVLWIYRRPNSSTRYEFLINEDGRVAQISLAAPIDKTPAVVPGGVTRRGIKIGSNYRQVLETYGMPERTRFQAGYQFMEAYYSKDYHAAFTFDTRKDMKVVRITIALKD